MKPQKALDKAQLNYMRETRCAREVAERKSSCKRLLRLKNSNCCLTWEGLSHPSSFVVHCKGVGLRQLNISQTDGNVEQFPSKSASFAL